MSEWWNVPETKPAKTDAELIPIAEGKYEAVLSYTKLDETEQPTKISLGWKIEGTDFDGRMIWQNFRMDERSAKWVKWQFDVIGAWQAGKGASDESDFIDKVFTALEEMKDECRVELEVEHNLYNGKSYTNGKVLSRLKESTNPALDKTMLFNEDEPLGF